MYEGMIVMAIDTNEVNLRAQNQFSKLVDQYTANGEICTVEVQAKLYAQALETQMLRSPSSAKWPDLSDIVVTKEGATYKVLGYCEVQNANGVYLRQEYTFNLVLNSDGKWETKDQFISTEEANSQRVQQEMAQIDKTVNSNAIVYFIITGIIGLIFFMIEMSMF